MRKLLPFLCILILLAGINSGTTQAQDCTYICVENSYGSIINGGVYIHVGDIVVMKGLFSGFFVKTADRDLLDNEANRFRTTSDVIMGLHSGQGFKTGHLRGKLSLKGGYHYQEFSVCNEDYSAYYSRGSLTRKPLFVEPKAALVLEFKEGASFMNLWGAYKYQTGERDAQFFDSTESGFEEFKLLADESQHSFTFASALTFRKNAKSDAFTIGGAYSGYENERETTFKQLIVNNEPLFTEHPRAEVAKTIGHRATGMVSYLASKPMAGTLFQFSSGWESVDSDIARDPLDPPFDNSVFMSTGIIMGKKSKILQVGFNATLFSMDKEGSEFSTYAKFFRHVQAGLNWGHAEYDPSLGVNDAPFLNDWFRASVLVSITEI